MRRTSRNIMRREAQRRAPARPCEIHFNSHAPGLVTSERLGRGTATGLILAIDEGERLLVGVADDETRSGLLDGPRRREAAGGLHYALMSAAKRIANVRDASATPCP